MKYNCFHINHYLHPYFHKWNFILINDLGIIFIFHPPTLKTPLIIIIITAMFNMIIAITTMMMSVAAIIIIFSKFLSEKN